MATRRLAFPWALTMQARLIAMAVAIALLAGLAGVTVMNRVAAREAQRLHDHDMQTMALMLLGLSAHEIDEMGPDATPEAIVQNQRADTEETLGDDYRYQVLSPDGRMLVGNHLMPDRRAMWPLDRQGFGDVEMDGQAWRIYAHHDAEQRKTIQLAERMTHRRWDITPDGTMVAMATLAFGIVLAVSLLLLRRMLQPLREVSGALQQRSIDRLEPIVLADAPPDVQPVIESVNRLMARVGEAFERERSFTAVAAHELRTPLASLRLLADAAAAAEHPHEREALLRELRQSVDRCAHLQSQLLTLARLDATVQTRDHEVFDLADVVVDAQADLLPLARQRNVNVSVRLSDVAMRGDRFGVRTLVGNLLGNGVRYTPPGGRVEVCALSEGRSVIVKVEDSGPGIPPAHRERVFERFVRLHGGQDSGVGLGLAIVRAVVKAHAATLHLGDSPLGGLSIAVTFHDASVQDPTPSPGAGEALAPT